MNGPEMRPGVEEAETTNDLEDNQRIYGVLGRTMDGTPKKMDFNADNNDLAWGVQQPECLVLEVE